MGRAPLLHAPLLGAAPRQHFLNFLPLPHGHGSLRPTLLAGPCESCAGESQGRYPCPDSVAFSAERNISGLRCARPIRLRASCARAETGRAARSAGPTERARMPASNRAASYRRSVEEAASQGRGVGGAQGQAHWRCRQVNQVHCWRRPQPLTQGSPSGLVCGRLPRCPPALPPSPPAAPNRPSRRASRASSNGSRTRTTAASASSAASGRSPSP